MDGTSGLTVKPKIHYENKHGGVKPLLQKCPRRDPSLRAKRFAQDDMCRGSRCEFEEFECTLRLRFGERFVSEHEKEQPSAPPPIICVNDRILLEYAILTDRVGYNPDHRRIFMGDKPLWRLPCVAISQDKESSQIMLYCCESDWSPVGIAGCKSVADAKRLAEKMYPGVSACWVEAGFDGRGQGAILGRDKL